MKKLAILASLLTGTPCFAGAPILTCYFNDHTSIRLDLSSLDGNDGACRSAYYASGSPSLRYFVRFCPAETRVEGYLSFLADSGWVSGESFNNDLHGGNCEVFRRIDTVPGAGGGHGMPHPQSQRE